MLNIYDYSLINIDPAVDKNGHTTLAERPDKSTYRMYRNPWYYLREIYRISTQKFLLLLIKLIRGNIAQAYCILHGIGHGYVFRDNKARQNHSCRLTRMGI